MNQKLFEIEILQKKYTKKKTVDLSELKKKIKKNGYNVEIDVFHVIFWMIWIQFVLQIIKK